MRILESLAYVIIAKMLFWFLKPSNLIYILEQLLLHYTLQIINHSKHCDPTH